MYTFKKVWFIMFCLLLITGSAFSGNGNQESATTRNINPAVIPPTNSIGSNYLSNIQSSRSNGMGGLSVNLIGVESALYNPAAYALFFMNNNFTFSVPSSVNWLPELSDDIKKKSWSAGVGVSKNRVSDNKSNRFDMSLALAYGKEKFDYGTIIVTDALGNYVGTTSPYEKYSYMSLGVGVKYYLHAGFGFTLKQIENGMNDLGAGPELNLFIAKSDAKDFGFYLALPVHEFLNRNDGLQPNRIELTPSFAYVRMNDGDDISINGMASMEKLPKLSRMGLALDICSINNNQPFIGFMIGYEKEKDLVNDSDRATKYGVELSLYKMLYFRTGKYEPDNQEDISTFGFGFSLKGLLDKIKKEDNDLSENSTINYLLNHIDITFDYARWSQDTEALDNTSFLKLNLSM